MIFDSKRHSAQFGRLHLMPETFVALVAVRLLPTIRQNTRFGSHGGGGGGQVVSVFTFYSAIRVRITFKTFLFDRIV